MNRMLIDLTDLETWSGNHGGTQRVVYGIAKEYYEKSVDEGRTVEVVYIAFSSREKAYYKTSFIPILERVEQLKLNSLTVNESYQPSFSLKGRIKRKVRPYVPESILRSPLARKQAAQLVKFSVYAVNSSMRIAKSNFKRTTVIKNTEKIKFIKSDTVLILGTPWDDPNIQKELTFQKSSTGLKVVQLVYDLIIPLKPHLHHRSLFKNYTQNMFEAISVSDLLLPISQSTLRDLRVFAKRLNLSMPPSKVIRLADEIVDRNLVNNDKPSKSIHDEFIACIGTVEIRKNHMLLYHAYKLSLEQGLYLPQLIIIGGRGWLSDNLQYLIENDPDMKDRILILDNINDLGLDWVYKNCLFTVYPSIYEGWGLPVAESAAYGKLCLSSSSSSITEIAGDLLDYFSPFDSKDCLNKITYYLDHQLRSNKENNLRHNYKLTKWSETQEQVTEAVTKINE
jgi:hypothetical protein